MGQPAVTKGGGTYSALFHLSSLVLPGFKRCEDSRNPRGFLTATSVRTDLQSDPTQGQRVPVSDQLMPPQPSAHSSPPFSLGVGVNLCTPRGGGRSKRTPCVPTVTHLLGHCTVDILREPTGHQVDGGSAAEVPAKRCIVLQPIAGAILQEEHAGNKELVCGWSPAHPPPPHAQVPWAQVVIIPSPSLQSSDHLPAVTIFLLARFPACVHP